MVPASLFCVGDVPQILRVNRRRKPTSRRKCVTEKTQEEKGRQERKCRRKKIVRRGKKREKGAVGQKACGSVNEQSSAGGKRAKRALIRSALPAATARWVGIGCGVGSRGGD